MSRICMSDVKNLLIDKQHTLRFLAHSHYLFVYIYTYTFALVAWARRRVEHIATEIQQDHGDTFVAAGLHPNSFMSSYLGMGWLRLVGS